MKIELFIHPDKTGIRDSVSQTAAFLHSHGAALWVPAPYGDLPQVSVGRCPDPDLILVLGGDGSLMRAAHRAAMLRIPLLCVNFGRLGYLAELEVDEIGLLAQLFSGEYRIERRMMLAITPKKKDARNETLYIALNDAVLSHGRVPRLLETEVLCGGRSLGRYHSDGFIVATPTGSTAYSLSAGGAVLDPSLQGIALTPICPHSLLARPIVVPADSDIELRYRCPVRENAYLTVDGEEVSEILPGECVGVRRSPLTADLIRLKKEKEKSFYDILREKMSDV